VKLLLRGTGCHGFLLSLLQAFLAPQCSGLLGPFCHRTGERSQEVLDLLAALSRLRAALSRLWLAYPASAQVIPPNGVDVSPQQQAA